jgi:hypothetical protein
MDVSMVGLWMCQWQSFGCINGRVVGVSMVELWVCQC